MTSIKGDTIDTRIIQSYFTENLNLDIRSNVKPLPDDHGREITINIQTDIQNKGEFWTDSNGMALEKRTYNSRPFPDFNCKNVTCNYYPVNSAIAIRDETDTMTLLNDRAQGGTSFRDGNVELMIQRRNFFDDDRGVDEALNETLPNGFGQRVYTRHLVELGEEGNLKKIQRHQFEEPLQVFYSLDQVLQPTYLDTYLTTLDHNLKVVLRPESKNTLLIRLFNMHDSFDKGGPLSTNVEKLAEAVYQFANHELVTPVMSITEVSLTGNQDLPLRPVEVTLNIQEMRTWRVTYSEPLLVSK